MLPKAAWFRCFQCGESFESEIRAALPAAGIRIEMDSGGPYGLVCFENVDEQLLAVLHEVRRDPGRRVLAVPSSSRVADSATIWRLLHAGASDVLPWAGNGEGIAQLAARFH